MTSIWILPSRGRKALCQQALDSYADTKMTSKGLLFVDTRIDDYEGIKLPDNWTKIAFPYDMAETLRFTYRNIKATTYGWLADDLFARTHYWDKELEDAADGWYIAHCYDMDIADKSAGKGWMFALTGGICWGGSLLKAVGWWALPEVRQAGIDDAWVCLCIRYINLRYYLSDVIFEHCNYRTGKRPKDETDSWVRNGIHYIDGDFAKLRRWRDGPESGRVLAKLKKELEMHNVVQAPIIP